MSNTITFLSAMLTPPKPAPCKEPITKIWNKYSQKRNWAAIVPISTFMCLWAIYILYYQHRRSAYSAAGKFVDRSWEDINRSQTHECGYWDWGHAVPFLGIFDSVFRYCIFAVWSVLDVAFYSLVYNNCSSSIKKNTRFWNKLPKTCFTTLSMLFTWNNILFSGVI